MRYLEQMIRSRTESILIIFFILSIALLSGCSTLPLDQTNSIEEAGEKLIWRSNDKRPKWTMEEPDKQNSTLSFVGLSATHSTEKGARKDARRNAVSNISSYIGTLAKNKFENAYVSYGLGSSVLDPTTSSLQFGKQLTDNIVNRVKTKRWYAEKWQTETGIGYRVFVLAKISESALSDSYKTAVNNLSKDAQFLAIDAENEAAKKQAAMAAEFWNQMETQGLIE